VTPEAYSGFGFPGADDLANMFQFMADFNDDFRGVRSVEDTRKHKTVCFPLYGGFIVFFGDSAVQLSTYFRLGRSLVPQFRELSKNGLH
jgi:hypothetical protein